MIINKKFFYLLIIIACIILQKSFIPLFFSGEHLPDIVLMLVLAWTIVDGFDGFLWWSVLAGILADLFFYTNLGTHVLIFIGVVYLVSFFARRFLVDIRSTGILLIVFFIVFATLFSQTILFFAAGGELGADGGLGGFLGSAGDMGLRFLYNGLFFLVLMFMLKKVKRLNF